MQICTVQVVGKLRYMVHVPGRPEVEGGRPGMNGHAHCSVDPIVDISIHNTMHVEYGVHYRIVQYCSCRPTVVLCFALLSNKMIINSFVVVEYLQVLYLCRK